VNRRRLHFCSIQGGASALSSRLVLISYTPPYRFGHLMAFRKPFPLLPVFENRFLPPFLSQICIWHKDNRWPEVLLSPFPEALPRCDRVRGGSPFPLFLADTLFDSTNRNPFLNNMELLGHFRPSPNADLWRPFIGGFFFSFLLELWPNPGMYYR